MFMDVLLFIYSLKPGWKRNKRLRSSQVGIYVFFMIGGGNNNKYRQPFTLLNNSDLCN